jgi:hypothetical protein
MNTSRREDYLFPSIGAIALWRDTLCQMSGIQAVCDGPQ